jgi:glycosyltransferase involved in cell wall biosynthesis
MLVENPFPADPRVRYEAYKLKEAGYRVSVVAIRYFLEEKTREKVNGVKVYRLPRLELFRKSNADPNWFKIKLYHFTSAIGYIFEYFYFTAACLLFSFYIAFKEGFDAIHVHNPPNTLFIIGLFHKLFGKKFVSDHHDLGPELFLSRYKLKGGFLYQVLLLEEKLCLRCADMVIATNQSYKEIDIKRGKKRPGQIFIVRNGPNLNEMHLVSPDEELQKMGKNILVYIGVMGPQDGMDYLLRSIHYLVNELHRKDFYCLIIGRGDAVEDLKKLRDDLNLNDFVRFTGLIPREDLIRYLSTADICLDPNPSSPLNDVSTWIKVMEYMSLSKPIVSFDLKETRYSAQEAAVYVTPNNEKEFAKAIRHLMDHPEERMKRGEYGRKRVQEELAWNHVSKNLLAAYEWLFNKPSNRFSAIPHSKLPDVHANEFQL